MEQENQVCLKLVAYDFLETYKKWFFKLVMLFREGILDSDYTEEHLLR